MAAMYFDDLTVQDLQSNKGSSQRFCIQLASRLGSPFSEEKHQPMSGQADFLGLWHNVGSANPSTGVTFWIRDRLLQKVQNYVNTCRQTNALKPGVASKLYGCLTFLTHGCWGKVGRYDKGSSASLTSDIQTSLDFILNLLSLRPERIYSLDVSRMSRFVIASDAAQDHPLQGSAGALILHPSGRRDALVLTVDDRLFALWNEHPARIAQLELCVVAMTIASLASSLRAHHGLWFVDNIASLMSLIKGRSPTLELDLMSGMVHAMLCGLQCMIYWEWVASAAVSHDWVCQTPGYTDTTSVRSLLNHSSFSFS